MPAALTSHCVRSPTAKCGDDTCCPIRTSLTGLAEVLTLKPMTPLRSHKGVTAALRLDRIEWLEIAGVERDATTHTTQFVIHIFTKKDQSRLPTSRLAAKPTLKRSVEVMAKPSRTEPDYMMRRTFAEFKTLHDDLMFAVQQRSHGQYCQLCNDFQSLLLFTSTRPMMTLRAFLTTHAQANVVHKLLYAVVALFQAREPSTGRRDGCEAAHEVPLVLYQFLFDEDL